MRGEGDAVFDLEGHLGAEVVHQVLADAGEMTNRWYPELPQLVLGADAREHQQMGRSDRPGAQHHPVGFDPEHLPAAFGFHADGLAVLDHDLADEHPAPHRQVQMVAHRTEMRHRSAHPARRRCCSRETRQGRQGAGHSYRSWCRTPPVRRPHGKPVGWPARDLTDGA